MEENKGCVYCKWTEDDNEPAFLLTFNSGILRFKNSLNITIEDNEMVLSSEFDGNYHDLMAKEINYCPMCGRKLAET